MCDVILVSNILAYVIIANFDKSYLIHIYY